MSEADNTQLAAVSAERDFLLGRLMADHNAMWVGRSSDAMVIQALSGEAEPRTWPRHDFDLARCEETYRRAPKHLKRLMLPTLERFRARIKARQCATS